MYGLGNNGGTPGGRLGGAFPKRETASSPCVIPLLDPKGMPSALDAWLPEVVATELRVEAVTVELLPRLRPRLLPLLRPEETLTAAGGAETVLDVVEKVLEEEWRFASLSTLVCFRGGRGMEERRRETVVSLAGQEKPRLPIMSPRQLPN